MAGPLIRVAASTGAFVAIVTAGGTGAAVSAADPEGPRSPSSHSRDDGPSDAHREGHRGRDHESRDADRRGPSGRGLDRRHGSKNRDEESPTVTVAGRAAPVVSEASGDDPAASSPGPIGQVTSNEVPDVAAVVRPRGSSLPSVAERVPNGAPTVTVGNGRSPAVPSARPDDVPAQVAPVLSIIVPPAVVPPAVVPSPAPPPPAQLLAPVPTRIQAEEPEIPAAAAWGTMEPGWPTGALFGLAGLMLAPIAGVWIGHRQARAVKSASQLVRS